MAKFKPGQSGNPGGRKKTPPHVLKAKRMNTVLCQELMDKLIKMSLSEIKAMMQNPDTQALELMLGKIIAEAISKGDHVRLNFILDRTIGKVKDEIEINTIENYDDAELDKRIDALIASKRSK